MGARSVALTGVSASGAVGSVSETNNPTEDGVVAIGSVGTVGLSVTVALTGVSAAGAVGTVVYVTEAALTGVSATGNVGSVSVGARLVAITGSQAMGAVGNFGVFYWSLIDDSQNANWQNISNTQTPGWVVVDTT
jgi:hypothetical protein